MFPRVPLLITLNVCVIFATSYGAINGLNEYAHAHNRSRTNRAPPLYKTALTQRGYIQFLRYPIHVPEIHDFTFCIWIKSENFTFRQPLLSYSHHEERRRIRAWISPRGSYVNLAVQEHVVIRFPVKLVANKWYHICQSWTSAHGHAGLFINNKLAFAKFYENLKGLTFEEHGDIVVGQEYTDFDKGLDDGIEGQIFGFNMILESALHALDKPDLKHTLKHGYNQNGGQNGVKHTHFHIIKHDNIPKINLLKHRRNDNPILKWRFKRSPKICNYESEVDKSDRNATCDNYELFNNQTMEIDNIGRDSQPVTMQTHVQNGNSIRAGKATLNPKVDIQMHKTYKKGGEKTVPAATSSTRTTIPTVLNASNRSLGKRLVEMGYKNCVGGHGAPIDHKKLLISWSSTPVRVFGGAVWKPANSVCGNF